MRSCSYPPAAWVLAGLGALALLLAGWLLARGWRQHGDPAGEARMKARVEARAEARIEAQMRARLEARMEAELAQRLREARQALEREFAQRAAAQLEQVAQRERKRIAADLHDDLGAKLLTIVHTSDSERISTLAREALEQMRLAVRGLVGRPVRLADALGDWRAEAVSRLTQAGIRAEWSSPEASPLPGLPPPELSAPTYVQATRILREAVSNVIRHSGASHCEVECAVLGEELHIALRDDGRGLPPADAAAENHHGHGLEGMRHRAEQMQGRCVVESSPGRGTVIRLTIPLHTGEVPHEA